MALHYNSPKAQLNLSVFEFHIFVLTSETIVAVFYVITIQNHKTKSSTFQRLKLADYIQPSQYLLSVYHGEVFKVKQSLIPGLTKC